VPYSLIPPVRRQERRRMHETRDLLHLDWRCQRSFQPPPFLERNATPYKQSQEQMRVRLIYDIIRRLILRS
jgi:hypothetical protein